MKISKLFHWLYATLMFLPLLIAPIFAIFTRNENYSSNLELQVQQNKVVDFNQQIPNGDFNNNIGWSVSGSTGSGIDYIQDNVCRYHYSSTFTLSGLYPTNMPELVVDHIYLAKCDVVNLNQDSIVCSIGQSYTYFSYLLEPNVLTNVFYRWRVSLNSGNYRYVYLGNRAALGSDLYFEASNFMLVDLTQMYGSGNEPFTPDFNNDFPLSYYQYTLSNKVLMPTDNIVYNDTDIGSQFIYTLYNSTDRYLNFDNVYNLYELYDWIEFNVFNGNAPLVWTIAWHYLDYWLILSIYWLCFDVIMYVPLLAHRWLDKASLE